MALSPLGIFSAAGATRAPRIGVAGYFSGGSNSSGNGVTTVDKYAFPAESRSTLATGLSSGRWGSASFANSGVAGYNAGGSTSNTGDGSTNVTTVDKFAMPADTQSTLGTGLSALTRHNAGMANSGVAGYSCGGFLRPSNANTATVDKFAFPSDTRSTLSSGLSTARRELAAFGNTGVAGYVLGGYASDFTSTVDKYAFPGDTISTLGTGLSTTRRDLSGFANQGTAGYVAGGNGASGVVATVDKFALPSDTRSTLGTGLSSARSPLGGGIVDATTAGYVGGGNTTTTVDKFLFVDDSRTTLGTGLSATRNYVNGFSDEGVF
jgi:hypothetical protein